MARPWHTVTRPRAATIASKFQKAPDRLAALVGHQEARARRQRHGPQTLLAANRLRLDAQSVCQHGKEQERYNVGDLDHRVDGWAGSVLVGIADGVAGHGRLVGVGALAAEMAVLDVFLGV